GGGDACDVCPADPTDTCLPQQTASTTVGSTGGVVGNPDGSVALIIPAGTLATPTSVSITGGMPTSQYGTGTAATRVRLAELDPSGVTFPPPITAEFHWKDADANGIVDGTTIAESTLQVWRNGVAITGPCGAAASQPPQCTTACCYPAGNFWRLRLSQF